MNPAFQKDAALLADLGQTRAAGRSRLWWLGQSGFLLVTPDATILFDPYLSDSLTNKYAATDKPHVRMTERVIAPEHLNGIDFITSSHNHTDHLDAETLRPLLEANPQAQLLIPRANRAVVLERIRPLQPALLELNAGESLRAGSVTFHGVTAAHNTVERDAAGQCQFLGYVAQTRGRTVYHSGDTLRHEGLVESLQPLRVDVALLPINGNKPERRVAGNLDGREAAALAHAIGARLAVPHHFDMFAFNTESPAEFEAACRQLHQPFQVLQNGEGLDI